MDIEEIKLFLIKTITEIIEEYVPHKWIYSEEPFYNQYKDKVSYDYSGEVSKMTIKDLNELADNLGCNPVSCCYQSEFEELLGEIKINSWIPTYVSNHGKNWISYKDLLEEKFNEWKYENFQLYDKDGNELNEELEQELDDLFYEFLKNTSYEFYYKKILKDLENNL